MLLCYISNNALDFVLDNNCINGLEMACYNVMCTYLGPAEGQILYNFNI